MNRQQRRAADRGESKLACREATGTEDDRFRRQVLTYLGVRIECDAVGVFAAKRGWPEPSDFSQRAAATWCGIVSAILSDMRTAPSDVARTALEFELETTIMNAFREAPGNDVVSQFNEAIIDIVHIAANNGTIAPAFFEPRA